MSFSASIGVIRGKLPFGPIGGGKYVASLWVELPPGENRPARLNPKLSMIALQLFSGCHALVLTNPEKLNPVGPNILIGGTKMKKERGMWAYIWKEHIEPLYIIPLFPFALVGGIANRALQPVPKSWVKIVKFGTTFLLLVLAVGIFAASVRAYLGGKGVIISAFGVWAALGSCMVTGFVWSGNWQIKDPEPIKTARDNARDVT